MSILAKIALGTTALVAMGSTAMAADLMAPPPAAAAMTSDWTGGYIGVEGPTWRRRSRQIGAERRGCSVRTSRPSMFLRRPRKADIGSHDRDSWWQPMGGGRRSKAACWLRGRRQHCALSTAPRRMRLQRAAQLRTAGLALSSRCDNSPVDLEVSTLESSRRCLTATRSPGAASGTSTDPLDTDSKSKAPPARGLFVWRPGNVTALDSSRREQSVPAGDARPFSHEDRVNVQASS